eukprot:IDg16608t1
MLLKSVVIVNAQQYASHEGLYSALQHIKDVMSKTPQSMLHCSIIYASQPIASAVLSSSSFTYFTTQMSPVTYCSAQCAVVCTVTYRYSSHRSMSVACASARILTPSPMVAPEKNGAPPRRAPLRNTSDAIARTGSRPDAPICEFGDFAVNYLSSLHCGDSAPLAAHVLRAAAEAHVFRFDPALPADFVRERIARASSALVSRAHLPPAAARHWLHCALRDAAHAYFDTRWARVPAVVVANTPVVARLRRAALQSHDIVDDDAAPDARIARLPPHAIAHLVAPGRPVLLNVFTQYCSKCAALEPIFDAAASDPERPARFAAIDASLHPEARALFAVTVFPTVLL